MIAFDKGKTFRHDKYADYKGGRSATPDELIIQFKKARELVVAMGFKYFEMSAKINMNVFEVINRLIEECIKELNPDNISHSGRKLSQKHVGGKKESCC